MLELNTMIWKCFHSTILPLKEASISSDKNAAVMYQEVTQPVRLDLQTNVQYEKTGGVTSSVLYVGAKHWMVNGYC